MWSRRFRVPWKRRGGAWKRRGGAWKRRGGAWKRVPRTKTYVSARNPWVDERLLSDYWIVALAGPPQRRR